MKIQGCGDLTGYDRRRGVVWHTACSAPLASLALLLYFFCPRPFEARLPTAYCMEANREPALKLPLLILCHYTVEESPYL